MKKKEESAIEQTIHIASFSYIRRLPLVEKACRQCGKLFTGVKQTRFCSRGCQAKADYAKHGAKYRKNRMKTYRAMKRAQKAKKEPSDEESLRLIWQRDSSLFVCKCHKI